jgi:FkbM family methyltransferase
MAFQNLKKIVNIGSPVNSWKLVLLAAAFSRPEFRSVSLMLLRPFTRDGMVSVCYRCNGRDLRILVRLSDLPSDFLGLMELGVSDTYELDHEFRPDLVIDGGGNIGLFTLRAAATNSSIGDSPIKLVICEPLPRNVEHIKRHLDGNRIEAEILQGCLGGTRRSVPFYCREAIDSSFDPEKPYTNVIDMPVYPLRDAIAPHPAKRILIKLDIEGMEIETLEAFIPSESRPVYLVGELHQVSVNAVLMQQIFSRSGWPFEISKATDGNALFRACSPAALPFLPSMASLAPARPAEIPEAESSLCG